MRLTDAEQRFLTRQPRGHLSTIGPDGSPQVKPLGFTYNAALGRIHPRRLIAFNVDPEHPGLETRDEPTPGAVRPQPEVPVGPGKLPDD